MKPIYTIPFECLKSSDYQRKLAEDKAILRELLKKIPIESIYFSRTNNWVKVGNQTFAGITKEMVERMIKK